MAFFHHAYRLEPDPHRRSFAEGFASAVHDPLWFLARQWQVGEHQGEDASSPVLVQYTAIGTRIEPMASDTRLDPARMPAEAIVEGEPDDWWTLGRRVRLGRALAARAGLDAATAQAEWLLAAPPPPYDRLAGCFDGLALWRARAALDPDGTVFAPFDIPASRPTFWDDAQLAHEASFPVDPGAPGLERSMRFPRHHGGRVDWFSADHRSSQPFVPAGDATERHAYPTQLRYPGAPASRWWEIEDAAVDIAGYPPDSAHFATTLLIDLIASHGDDWFTVPIDGRAGDILTVTAATVTDSFGEVYRLEAPRDWWLFRTTGLDSQSLVVWLPAVSPIVGPAIESTLIGIDESANLLWAVERRLDGHDVVPVQRTPEQEAANPTRATPGRDDAAPDARAFEYVPGQDAPHHWHPYALEVRTDEAGRPRRRFVQRRLADLARETPELTAAARAAVLRRVDGAGTEAVHEIDPATVLSNGLVLERAYRLARDIAGNPVLWLERHRGPSPSPPARIARFDVFATIGG